MKILAIDVGTGTEDILLYDTEKEIENSLKMVIPSPHLKISKLIEKCDNDIYFDGVIMGGGHIKQSCQKHLEKGYKIVFNELAAKTIRDDLNQVKSYGFEISDYSDEFKDYDLIPLKDVDVNQIIDIFSQFELDLEVDEIAVAVQDHGYSEDMGDRDFRFEKIREKLDSPKVPEVFAMEYNEVPEYFTRMQSVIKSLEDQTVMDIGNGHTTVASIEDGLIQGVFEHHTSSLTPERFEELVNLLADGTIKHEDVYCEGGHGAFALNPISKIEKVIVAGPRRGIIEDTNMDYYYATPAGDVMMTGTVGLVKSMEYLRR